MKFLMTSLIVGADVLLAWGISSLVGISFDRALLLATVVELSYERSER